MSNRYECIIRKNQNVDVKPTHNRQQQREISSVKNNKNSNNKPSKKRCKKERDFDRISSNLNNKYSFTQRMSS